MLTAIDDDVARYPADETLDVFLGDYIDRGPASRQVIDLLIERGSTRKAIFLRGNHETYVPQFFEDPAVLRNWRVLGGLETLRSYGLVPSFNANPDEQCQLADRFAATLPQSHVLFFAALRSSFCCGDFFFVHAGVRPGIPLEQQREQDLLWIRNEFLLHEGSFGKIIVHGHLPVQEPEFRHNRINIDTGAYATGKLTCLIIEHDQLALLNVNR